MNPSDRFLHVRNRSDGLVINFVDLLGMIADYQNWKLEIVNLPIGRQVVNHKLIVMFLYNVTVGVDSDIEMEWLHWMKTKHIPDVLGTGMFVEFKIYKVLHDDNDSTVSYSTQYFANSLELVVQYLEVFAPALIEEHRQKFLNKHVAFSTLLEEVWTFFPECVFILHRSILVPLNRCAMNAKKVSLEELKQFHFASEDALSTFDERFERQHKLRTAMSLTNVDHESITLVIKLANGDLIEVASDLIDYEDDFVEIRGGIGIPLKAIVDVGV